MKSDSTHVSWRRGVAPVAVVMISLNEAHNMRDVLANLSGWAQEVFLVDSFSSDATVDIALSHGVHVVQRKFRGFGDQWNFAMRELPISAAWTMKLDPDERMTPALKEAVVAAAREGAATGLAFSRRLWFLGRPLPIRQDVLRVWKTGTCVFTGNVVNEHPIVSGRIVRLRGELEHHDSPSLYHWVLKQNRYTSAEAFARFMGAGFAVEPALFGSGLSRRMWFKKHFMKVPARYQALYLMNLIRAQPWRSGYAGTAWARYRVWVRRSIEDKLREMEFLGRALEVPEVPGGVPHPDAHQAD